MKRFETIKKAIPQYEELKTVYLQLRQAGLEDELYKGIDLNNINYPELLKKATKILEKNAKIDKVQPDISDERERKQRLGLTTEAMRKMRFFTCGNGD